MGDDNQQTADRDRVQLEQLGSELAAWRSTHKAPGRKIPEEMWARAAGLGLRMGIWSVSKFLRLEYNYLKRRCDAQGVPGQAQPRKRSQTQARAEQRATPAPTFVELLPAKNEGVRRCSLEIESRGTRVCLVVEDVGVQQVAALVRHLLA